MKKILSLLLALVLVLSLAACQEDPDGTIVVHKDMDNLISKAQESSPEKVEAGDILDEVAESYEIYQTTLEDESLGVKVTVDAQVDVPEVDTLSVYRVKQKPFTQAFVDKVRQVLMGDKAIYQGDAVSMPTKADIEVEIEVYRQLIADEEARMAAASEEDRTMGSQEDRYVISVEEFRAARQQNIEVYQYELDKIQERYENAPVKVDLEDYASDGKFAAGEDDKEEVSIVADSSDGRYQVLIASNSESNSNLLYYRASPEFYLSPAYDAFQVLDPDAYDGMPDNPTVPENFLSGGLAYSAEDVFMPFENDETTIPEEKAMETATAFLSEIGIEGFTFSEGGLYNIFVNSLGRGGSQSGNLYYRHCYIFRFQREVAGVQLTQASGAKYAESGSGDDFRKQYWPGEVIEILINDTGIIGFDYMSPIEITETVVENTALKSFESVKETAEKMLCVINAVEDTNLSVEINIDRVRLSYSRISEKDSFDTGLIVPVWSFEGTKYYLFNGEMISQNYGTCIAINAVDGSIIDGEAGY